MRQHRGAGRSPPQQQDSDRDRRGDLHAPEFRRIFRARAADIINPDVSNCGGILELMYIAAAGRVGQIAVSPHNYNSTTVSLSATVHAAACMPNFIITEYFLPFEEMSLRVAPNALVPRDGYLDLPTGPGLGLEIDEAVIANSPAGRYPARTFLYHPRGRPVRRSDRLGRCSI